ncbi:ComEA family DNA-binding protein [Streptomyces phaeofaciens JCM 4814]|uniref:DNA-binding protein n=1 Tax=Streptomyces phaeofaciens TaxID=68254 RepID=A0A918LRQ0_9ACTN|nr:DNA-binding protein [Streptomyces phaeofaciens]
MRRRAEALFADRAVERRKSATGPPGVGEGPAGRGPKADVSGAGAGAGVRAGARAGAGAGAGAEAGARVGAGLGAVEERVRGAGRWRERAGAALRERLPVWVQARCGIERRSVQALTVVLVVAAGFAAHHFWAGRAEPVRAPEVVRAAPREVEEPEGAEAPAAPAVSGATGGAAGGAPSGSAPGAPGAEIVVDVSGKVREPGIHRLPAGSRVVDALDAAGGVRPGTNTDGLNRARFLVDGEQVVVGGPAPPAPGAGGGAAGPVGAGAGPAGVVSLNTATVEQLDTLPGVGPVLAQHIVDHRTRHGGFRSVEELRDVNGIGERRYADLRNLVRP